MTQPMTTEEFLQKLIDSALDELTFRDKIAAWLEGDWSEALDGVTSSIERKPE